MRSHTGVLASSAILVLVVSSGVQANPGDPRVLQGVLAWSPGAEGPPFIVVRGDDGRHHVADIATAQRVGDPVSVGDRVSLVGVEGPRPWQMSVIAMGSGDTALAVLSTPRGAAVAPAPAAPRPPARPAEADGLAASRSWRRIQGRVDALDGKTLRLRDAQGRNVTVDISQLSGNPRAVLRPGDHATVFVVAGGDQRLVAVGFVQTDGAAGSALPRQPR